MMVYRYEVTAEHKALGHTITFSLEIDNHKPELNAVYRMAVEMAWEMFRTYRPGVFTPADVRLEITEQRG